MFTSTHLLGRSGVTSKFSGPLVPDLRECRASSAVHGEVKALWLRGRSSPGGGCSRRRGATGSSDCAAPGPWRPLCGQPIAGGVVWERGRAFISLRPALPPVRPRIRAHNAAGSARHARAEPSKGMWSGASDRRSAPLRRGRSVGRGSARANRRGHVLLRLVRRAVRRLRESASWSNEGKWSNGTFSGCRLLGVT